jgi:hypothetical protein
MIRRPFNENAASEKAEAPKQADVDAFLAQTKVGSEKA